MQHKPYPTLLIDRERQKKRTDIAEHHHSVSVSINVSRKYENLYF